MCNGNCPLRGHNERAVCDWCWYDHIHPTWSMFIVHSIYIYIFTATAGIFEQYWVLTICCASIDIFIGKKMEYSTSSWCDRVFCCNTAMHNSMNKIESMIKEKIKKKTYVHCMNRLVRARVRRWFQLLIFKLNMLFDLLFVHAPFVDKRLHYRSVVLCIANCSACISDTNCIKCTSSNDSFNIHLLITAKVEDSACMLPSKELLSFCHTLFYW